MKRAILAIACLLPLLAACNTIEGAGSDLKAGGSGIEDSAAKHKNY